MGHSALSDDALFSANAITIGFSPLAESSMQVDVVPMRLVEDWCYVLGGPSPLGGCFLTLGIDSEREHFWRGLAQEAVRGEGIRHVAQHGIVEAVADKAHGVVAKQLADKPCGPTLREVGKAKVSTGENESLEIAGRGIFCQQAVEIDQSVPALLGNGEKGLLYNRITTIFQCMSCENVYNIQNNVRKIAAFTLRLLSCWI